MSEKNLSKEVNEQGQSESLNNGYTKNEQLSKDESKAEPTSNFKKRNANHASGVARKNFFKTLGW